jgi:GYD domain
MPIYISRGRFTSDAIKGMLAKPENREEAVAKLFKSVGGKLIGWYLTFGHHDSWSLASSLTRRPRPLRYWPLLVEAVCPKSRRPSP